MPLTSCQSSMTLAAGAERSKVDYKPLHHVGNSNEYRANTDQYVCNFACLYFTLSVLGAPGPILQPDIRPTRRLFDLMKRHSVSEDGHGDRANDTRCESTVPGLPVLRVVPQGEHGGERQTGDDAASESRIGRPAATWASNAERRAACLTPC
jgi:hypothetical protein